MTSLVWAQQPLLQTKVSLHQRDISIQDALKVLQLKYGIPFSYSSSVIPANKKIQVYLKQVTLEVALKVILLDTEIGFEQIGSHIVLRRIQMPKPTGRLSTKNKPVLPVKIPDEESDETPTLLSPDSGKLGSEKIFATLPNPEIKLMSVPQDSTSEQKLDSLFEREKSKFKQRWSEMKDSLKARGKWTTRQLDLIFQDIQEELHQDYFRLRDSIRNQRSEFLSRPGKDMFRKHTQLDSTSNGYAHRKFQGSFVYPIGSNGAESPYFINRISLNLLAGYNGGVEGLELSGFANVIKAHVLGVQLAGFTNVVGGDVSGFQASGFANINGARTSGIQSAGFANINKGTCNGIQYSGFINVNGSHTRGIQASGFMNLVGGNMDGIQLSGFMNVNAKHITGFQGAGFANIVGGRFQGTQVSGFLNVCRKLRGVQLGVINITDSLERGVPIGFLSFVRNGKHSLELFTSEMFQANIAFKTGVKRFYNILHAGYQVKPNGYRWAYSYGVGTEVDMGKHWYTDIEGLVMHINENEAYTNDRHVNIRLQTLVGFKFSKHVALFAGPHIDYFVSDRGRSVVNDSAFWKISSAGRNQQDMIHWGFTAGLRLF